MGILFAGLAATFTVALSISVGLVVIAGAGSARNRSVAEHGLSAVVMILLFGLALSQRGVSSPDSMTRWVLVGILFFGADLGRRGQGNLHASTVVWALLLASAAILLRLDVFGPQLGVLRGSWQSTPDRFLLFRYHLGSGIGLALVYGLAVICFRRVPSTIGRWVGAIGVLLLVSAQVGGWYELGVRFLLLHWPGPSWG